MSSVEGQPVPADEQVVGSVLPRDRDLVRWLASVGGCYLAAALLLVLLAGEDALRVLGYVVDVPMAVLAAAVLIRVARLRQLQRRTRLRPALLAPQLAAGIALAGIPDVRVRVGSRAVGRSYRAGRHGVVLLNDGMLDRIPLATTFVVAHELAHLARHDTLRQTVVAVYLLTISALSLWVLPWPAAAVIACIALTLAVTYTWTRELDCDRIASRCAGQRSGVAAMDAFTKWRSRNPLTRLWGAFSHPPLSLRRNAVLDPERMTGWFGPKD
ncbi:M48 family metalloprotease [Kutzneria chonburiensis]|uniref:M48 family metalloprotease n=1 Tax=Kutzneria chonburiensis TaxID=1483604 RepID=A0ABV6MJ84_9PSEU|nr:M48 family metalloprotease [Kutzneria chonburiensis]